MKNERTDRATILFGAFDRHNFGDLLFPHVAAALSGLPRIAAGVPSIICAGAAQRDLRLFGGHLVHALGTVARELRNEPVTVPVTVIHAGGEILTCNTWEAAVMLQRPARAAEVVARLHGSPGPRMEWAQRVLETTSLIPYMASPDMFDDARLVYRAVGGVGLDNLPAGMRAEVLRKLSAASDVTVRDRATLATLQSAGIAARLLPDPAVMTARLFGDRIRLHLQGMRVARLRKVLPQGYMAVQCSTEFGDDATLSALARQLDRASEQTGLGIAFFRAGAAPWHDDLDVYRRIAQRMRIASVRIFTSLNLWDICALIAGSRAYCGSSLHGRIIAAAFALPRVGLDPPGSGARSKQAAYAATWEPAGAQGPLLPVAVSLAGAALTAALATPPAVLQDCSEMLVQRYLQDG